MQPPGLDLKPERSVSLVIIIAPTPTMASPLWKLLVLQSLISAQQLLVVGLGKANEWTESALSPMRPPARWFSALGAIDTPVAGRSSERCLVVFGGLSAVSSWAPSYLFLDTQPSVLNDTWLFCERDRSWTSVDGVLQVTASGTPTTSADVDVDEARPPARIGHTMTPTPDRSALVLFGGFQARGTSSPKTIVTLNDTWLFRRSSDDGNVGWRSVNADSGNVALPMTAFHSSSIINTGSKALRGVSSNFVTVIVVGGVESSQSVTMHGQARAYVVDTGKSEIMSSSSLASIGCSQPFGALFSPANSSSLLYVCLDWDGQRRPSNARWTQSGLGSLQVWKLDISSGFSAVWRRAGPSLPNFAFTFYNYYQPKGVRLPVVQFAATLHESENTQSIVVTSILGSTGANPGSVLNEVFMFDVSRSSWHRLSQSSWRSPPSGTDWRWFAGASVGNSIVTLSNVAQDSTGTNLLTTLSSLGVNEVEGSFGIDAFASDPRAPLFSVGMAGDMALDGTAIVFGGMSAGADTELVFVDNITWHWNVVENAWFRNSYSDRSPSPRFAHSLTVVGSTAVVQGGCYRPSPSASFKLLADTWVYDKGSWQWSQLGDRNHVGARAAHATVRVSNFALMLGGLSSTSGLAPMNLWSLAGPVGPSSSWTKLATSGVGPPPMFGHSLVAVGSGQGDVHLYLIGGALCMSAECRSRESSNYWNTDIWRFDMSSKTWSNLTSTLHSGWLPMTKRAFHAASAIGDKIIVHGGCSFDVCVFAQDDLAQVYTCCRDSLVTRGSDEDALPWMLDTSTQTWTQLQTAGTVGRRLMHLMLASSTLSLHLLGGLDQTWKSVQNLEPVSVCAGQVCRLVPGCNPGAASEDISRLACKPCDLGSYADQAGSLACAACPAHTTSTVMAATKLSQCASCMLGTCNGNGVCTVQNTTGLQVVCNCDFGYSPSDRCRQRSKLFYTFLGLLCAVAVVIVMALVAIVRRAFFRKTPYDLLNASAGDTHSLLQLEESDDDERADPEG